MKLTLDRFIKIWISLLYISSIILIFYYTESKVFTQRYEGLFLGFIQMYLSNRISLNFLTFIPLIQTAGSPSDLSLFAQNIISTESHFPNVISMFIILVYTTFIPINILMSLPLGIFWIPIAFVALSKKISEATSKYNLTLNCMFLIYISIYLMSSRFYGSLYDAPFAVMLFLCALICIIGFYESNKKGEYVFLFIIILISESQYWHTMLMNITIYIFSIFIIRSILALVVKDNGETFFYKPKSLLIITIVISLAFMHLWDSSYFSEFIYQNSLIDFIPNAIIKFFGGNPFPLPYSWSYKETFFGKIYFFSLLLIYILSTLILFISLFYCMKYSASNKIKKLNGLIYSLSLIPYQILFAALYSESNSLAFPMVPILFPLFGISILTSNEQKFKNISLITLYKCIMGLMIILSIICVLIMPITSAWGTDSIAKYEDTENNFNWTYEHIDKSNPIVLDFNLIGKYVEREASISKPALLYYFLTPSLYGFLVGDTKNNSLNRTNFYAIIDYSTMQSGLPTHSYIERSMLRPEWDKINLCKNQIKVYQDNHISIFVCG